MSAIGGVAAQLVGHWGERVGSFDFCRTAAVAARMERGRDQQVRDLAVIGVNPGAVIQVNGHSMRRSVERTIFLKLTMMVRREVRLRVSTRTTRNPTTEAYRPGAARAGRKVMALLYGMVLGADSRSFPRRSHAPGSSCTLLARVWSPVMAVAPTHVCAPASPRTKPSAKKYELAAF